MKVTIISDWFLKYVAGQAVGLKAAGAQVLVVCRDHLEEFDGNQAEWEECIGDMQGAGVRICVVRGATSSIAAMRTAATAAATVRAWRPDVIHAHPNMDPWLHMASTGFPLVLTIHDPFPHEGQPEHGRVKTALSNAWRARADAFIVHGEALRAPTLATVGGRPIGVVPHGLRPSPQPYRRPSERRILFFGRLEPYKGIGVLMQAMEQVLKQQPDAELVVAGRGPSAVEVSDRPQIRRLFRYIPEAEIDGLLSAATVIAAPYTEASQSGVVSVAVARGIPTVVSNQGALPDLAVEPGLVVPAGDSMALARALLQYLDHDMTLRSRIHKFARDQLSWSATGQTALALYPDLLGLDRPR